MPSSPADTVVDPTDCIAVMTTVGSRAEAHAIARALVARGLVACAQISEIESVYRWNGALKHDREWRLLLKTVADRYDAVEEAIRAVHPYELPAIYALPVERAYGPYADWVRTESAGVDRSSDTTSAAPTGLPASPARDDPA